MRIIIAGGRTFTDENLATRSLCAFVEAHKVDDIQIVSGCARGADHIGELIAQEYMYPLHKFPADWNKYGKSAGYKRNEVMAQNADALLAFWDGESKGTKHMIDLANKHGLIVKVVRY